MTRYLCDTSVLVASVCDWHEHYRLSRTEILGRADSGQKLVLAAHSLAETYAVLTRLPGRYRIPPRVALALLEENWSETPTIHLDGHEVWSALGEARRQAATGGRMYDVLIAHSAIKAGASALVTWNVRHFAAFANSLDIVTPAG